MCGRCMPRYTVRFVVALNYFMLLGLILVLLCCPLWVVVYGNLANLSRTSKLIALMNSTCDAGEESIQLAHSILKLALNVGSFYVIISLLGMTLTWPPAFIESVVICK